MQLFALNKKSPLGLFFYGGNDEACLGFPPRSNSLIYEPYGSANSVFSLSGLTHLNCYCSCRLYGNPPNSHKAFLTTGIQPLKKSPYRDSILMAGTTRLELATSCVTGMRSNQTELRSHSLDKYNMLKKFLQ